MADSRSNQSRPPRKRSAGSRGGQGKSPRSGPKRGDGPGDGGKPPRSGPNRGDGPRNGGRGSGPKRPAGKPDRIDGRDREQPPGSGFRGDAGSSGSSGGKKPPGSRSMRDGGKPRASGPSREGGKARGSGPSRDGGKARGSGPSREDGKPRGSGPSRDGEKPRGSGSKGSTGRPKRAESSPRPDRGPRRDGDRRFEVRPERDTSNDLPWPEEIFDLELEPELLAELEAAGGPTATMAKHLLSVQVLAEDDPEAAYQHASRIRDRLPRAALARQTACIAAYRAGHFREAIKEESAYRRLSGSADLLPMAADSERGLQRPERALALLTEFEQTMEPESRTELLIVAAGARQDLGDLDAARVLAQKAVRAAKSPMAMARSRYALGRLLLESGDREQARKWLQSAVDLDEEGVWTDAAEVLDFP